VIGVHFYRTESERLAQAKALEAWLADQEPMPTLLAGDFNSYRGDSVLTHLEQTWHVVDKGEDFQTFPSWAPDREIDYFMWQPVDAFDVVSQDLLDEPVKSDHRPLVIEVQVTDHRR
jgi:endonuclease/exonuclease/phosphatase family metal-dependent hydrolase